MKATRLQSMPDLVKGRKHGKRVVLIESFAGEMAQYADQVVLVKPGTDGALALGMMYVLSRKVWLMLTSCKTRLLVMRNSRILLIRIPRSGLSRYVVFLHK